MCTSTPYELAGPWHRELKIGSYFSQPASRIRACRQIPVHARQPAARRRAQQACMQANPSACTPRAAAAGGRPAGQSGHDGEGLLAGTALSQPKAGSQPAAARRAQPLAAHDGAAAEPGRGQHVAAECRSTGRAHAPESD